MPDPAPIVICFGEILWDILPRGRFPGGAPGNVAYHLHQLGLKALLVSAVGTDAPGDELLARLRTWSLPVDGVSRHPQLPTGRVTATVGPAGDARYDIATGVAWDEIPVGTDTLRAAAQARAVVYGSLAQRSASNRASLVRLLAAAPSDALRVFDVNLRPPHDDPALVLDVARRSTLLKLNSGEAARLVGGAGSGREEAQARALADRTGCATVCLTAGGSGAGLLTGGRWHWAPGRPTRVRDTVGAGDAFLAGLLAGLIRHRLAPEAALARACRLGEFIAAHDGATPPYHLDAHGLPVENP